MNRSAQQSRFNRRIRTKKEIKQLIAERNNVLSQFYSLSSYTYNSEADDVDSLLETLQDFCQDMIDYVATGHFEIYRRIEDGSERRTEMLELADELFHKITTTTKVAISFNDFYDVSDEFNKDILNNLSTQLSELGENLAVRIELEDLFIDTLLKHNSGQNFSIN